MARRAKRVAMVKILILPSSPPRLAARRRFLITWTVAIEMACCLIFSYGAMGYMNLLGVPGVKMCSLNAMVPFIIAGVR